MADFNTRSPWGELARCVVNTDHTVAYFLDANDSNFKQDGSPVDWVEVENSGQNVMVQIPKFYFVKKWIEDKKQFYFGVAKTPVATDLVSIEDWDVHPAFFRDRTKLSSDVTAVPVEVDFRYVGAFEAWLTGGSIYGPMRSLPGKVTHTTDLATWRPTAELNGPGWGVMDFHLYSAIQMLFITEYANPDSQAVIGKGRTSGSSFLDSGATLAHGNRTFGTANYLEPMSYRGIEHLWGNRGCCLDGVLKAGGQRIVSVGNKGFGSVGQYSEKYPIGSFPTAGTYFKGIAAERGAGFMPTTASSSFTIGFRDHAVILNDGVESIPIMGRGVNMDIDPCGIFNYRFMAVSSADGTRLAL